LTIMYMSEWMDEWDILKIEEINIDILDKTPEIFKKFENIWPELLISTLKSIITWSIQSISQEHSQATYCSKISKEDGKIDFQKEQWEAIYNKYRAYYPWPWIYSYFQWKKIDITDCLFEKNDLIFDEDFHLWDVVEFEDHWESHIWILCKWWILILNKVKLEWKKEMNIKDFINGNKQFLDYNFIW
jgi:methionyl-tRNA formyltransferase